MRTLSMEDVKSLAVVRRDPCISIYMPTHRSGPDVQQDRIRLKNLLGQAQDRMSQTGMRSSATRELLLPAQRLLDDDDFWRHVDDGLALFLGPDSFEVYPLPMQFQQLLIVGERFHLKPLLPLLAEQTLFYVLAMSLKGWRMLECAPQGIRRMELPSAPRSFQDEMKYTVLERQVQFHSVAAGAGLAKTGVFHGQGAENDYVQHKKNVLQYCLAVSRSLQRVIHDRRTPLVFAGVENLFSIYRQANAYPALADDALLGNPDLRSDDQLRSDAWRIIQPQFQQRQLRAAARLSQLLGTGMASANLREILPAAHQGLVETMFLTVGVQQWGRYDSVSQEAIFHHAQEAADEDLIDLAAIQTLLHGGSVLSFQSGYEPGIVVPAVIFRSWFQPRGGQARSGRESDD